MAEDRTQEEMQASLTERDFAEFLSAAGEARWKILLSHAEKNKKNIKIRRLKTMQQNNEKQYVEISKQFEEFCHTKGIVAKFKVAFANMAENARQQKAADKSNFEEVKRQSAEANPEFTEFIHTKGLKAKVRLVIENIKKGAKESNEKVRKHIEVSKHGVPYKPAVATTTDYSAEELSREFNAFLKVKGLDGKYAVEVLDDSKN